MNEVAFLLEREYPWLELIAAHGSEGSNWVQEYRQPELSQLHASIIGTFKLMVRGEFERTRQILEEAEEKLSVFAGQFSASVVDMHDCWFRGVLAYYYYFCLEDYPRAESTMLQGHAAVAAAIQRQGVLLPAGYRCCDTWLHRARIARNQRNWPAMRERIDRFCAIVRSEEPFCTLNDGQEVYASDLDRYLSELTLNEELDHYVRIFRNSDNQRRFAQTQAQKVYILPWMPIQF